MDSSESRSVESLVSPVCGSSETSPYMPVIEAERTRITTAWQASERGPVDIEKLRGLALSGGGIRSASFALGVMQTLAATDADNIELAGAKGKKTHPSILQRLHYLSTVSGGGYAGTAVTRLVSFEDSPYDLGRNFPFRDPAAETADAAPTRISDIRYRASYLDADAGPVRLNAIAVIARTVLLTFAIYLCGLSAIIATVIPLLSAWPTGYDYRLNLAALLAIAAALVVVVLWLFYSLQSGLKKERALTIKIRTAYEKAGGWAAFTAILLLVAWAITVAGSFSHYKDKFGIVLGTTTIVGMIATIGTAITLYSQVNTLVGGLSDRRKSVSLLVAVSGLFLLGGMVVLARELAIIWHRLPAGDGTGPVMPPGLYADPWWWVWAAALWVIFIGAGLCANLNYVGLHRFYRDRLMRTFILPRTPRGALDGKPQQEADDKEADELHLDEVCDSKGQWLYHLINTNVVLVNSRNPRYRSRGGDSFLLSPLHSGSVATNLIEASKLREKKSGDMHRVSLASAMAISGAAINPAAGADGSGPTRSGMLPLILSLLGVRLGYWQLNPRYLRNATAKLHRPNYIQPGLLRGVLQYGHTEEQTWIELTDGGHFENMGLYELFRRKVRLIIAADGSTDPDFSMSSFASAYERARNDFQVEIDISHYPANFNDMMPDSARPDSPIKKRYQLAERGFAVGTFTYPEDRTKSSDRKEWPVGYIFYINTVLAEDLTSNLYSYKAEHPEFPDEPLTDQFFNEKQFDVYCQLGRELAAKMVAFAKTYRQLAAALDLKPNEEGVKDWVPIEDPIYMPADERLSGGFSNVTSAVSGLVDDDTLRRIVKHLTPSPVRPRRKRKN